METISASQIRSGLSSNSRQIKLSTLKTLQKYTDQSDSVTNMQQNLADIDKGVASLFSDPSETVCQGALDVYRGMLEKDWNIDGSISVLLNVLHSQLGEGTRQDSEEIRLSQVRILHLLMTKRENSTELYLDEIIRILTKALKDPFAEIRMESCKCVRILAASYGKQFLSRSDPVIDALLATFTHNQARVRAANTEAIGYALQYGNYKRIPDVWRSMAQRVIDSHHTVRRTAFNVLHLWMTQFPDRYSHWNRFVPLVICGLFDEISEIREECQVLWRDIGQQYEEENHDEVKEAAELDWKGLDSGDRATQSMADKRPLSAESGDWENIAEPDNERPLLGCRLLVRKVLFNVIQSNLNDLKDWQEGVRIQGIRLLYQLLLHAEHHSVVVIDKVLSALPCIAKDESRTVVLEAKNCARLVGRFIEPNVYCRLLVSTMENASHLVVLSGILSDVAAESLKVHIGETLTGMLKLTLTVSEAQHFYNLECCREILIKGSFWIVEYKSIIYSLLMNIHSLTETEAVKSKVAEALEILSRNLSAQSTDDLHSALSGPFLAKLLASSGLAGDWSSCSLEYRIFQNYLEERGLEVFRGNINVLLPAFIENLHASKNVRVRFGIFKLMLNVVQGKRTKSLSTMLTENKRDTEVVQSMFIPNLTWKPGRSEAILRAACCACLVVFVEAGLVPASVLWELKTDVYPKLDSLMRDEHTVTHQATLRLYTLMFQCRGQFTESELKQMYSAYMRGLDGQRPERLEALAGLKNVLNCSKTVKQNPTLAEEACRVLSIHLDESDRGNNHMAQTSM